MLTRTNYQEWALLMWVNMEAQGFWHAIEPDDDDDIVKYHEDRLALSAILRSVPNEMLGSQMHGTLRLGGGKNSTCGRPACA
jgi:hypothetical protein